MSIFYTQINFFIELNIRVNIRHINGVNFQFLQRY